jgi:IMP dehydrogenase
MTYKYELKSMLVEPTLDDILLSPRFSDIRSRSEVSLKTDIGNGIVLDLPIISSPMTTVTGHEMAHRIAKAGGLGIIHRYNTIEQQVDEVHKALEGEDLNVGAAIGTGDDYFERAQALVEAGAKVLCIDVAHGHHIMVREALHKLREQFGDNLHIMAGNVATGAGLKALEEWGADSARLGVGGGSICSTRIQTGHGVPNLTTILECVETATKIKMIIDGGIKNAGDITKALALGCDAVMVGSLLAGTDASPGEVYEDMITMTQRKKYVGMASKEAQMKWRGRSSAAEGVSGSVPYIGKLEDHLGELAGNIRSGLSYSGARNLKEFQVKAEIRLISHAAHAESKPHILTRG